MRAANNLRVGSRSGGLPTATNGRRGVNLVKHVDSAGFSRAGSGTTHDPTRAANKTVEFWSTSPRAKFHPGSPVRATGCGYASGVLAQAKRADRHDADGPKAGPVSACQKALQAQRSRFEPPRERRLLWMAFEGAGRLVWASAERAAGRAAQSCAGRPPQAHRTNRG